MSKKEYKRRIAERAVTVRKAEVMRLKKERAMKKKEEEELRELLRTACGLNE